MELPTPPQRDLEVSIFIFYLILKYQKSKSSQVSFYIANNLKIHFNENVSVAFKKGELVYLKIEGQLYLSGSNCIKEIYLRLNASWKNPNFIRMRFTPETRFKIEKMKDLMYRLLS